MLADGEVSAVRRITSVVARENGLSRCRIILPGGQIIADSNPSAITLRELPATWSSDAAPIEAPADGISQTFPLMVADRGLAQLEISYCS